MRKAVRAFTVLLVLVIGLHAYLARFAHPAADDFCYASKARGLSLWAWSVGEYHEWNGRYASNVLMWRNPLSWSWDFLAAYRLVPVLLLVLSALAYRVLIRALTERVLRPREEWCGALALLALFLNGMPVIGEGLYWYTGAVTYQLANIGSALLVASLLTFRRERFIASRPVHALLNAVLMVVMIGMNEQHMVLLGAGLLLWCLTAARKRQQAPWLLLLLAIAAAAVVMLAPGNAVRGSYFESAHHFLSSVGMTAIQTARFLGTWLLSPALLVCSLLYVQVHLHLRDRVSAFARAFGLTPWSAAALGLGVIALCIFPAYWSMGMLAQHRTLNVAYWTFLPLWCMGLSALLEHSRFRGRVPFMAPRQLIVAIGLAGAALLLTRNGGDAVGDLYTGRAARYDAAMHARYAAFAREGAIILTPLTDPPRTLAPIEEQHPD
ncbi:MAG TPA: hypothetical protein VHL57_00310, partial [Flavobacteriales bacterium]|nr:hypothetical protein [Flavobacteriales bacterium]